MLGDALSTATAKAGVAAGAGAVPLLLLPLLLLPLLLELLPLPLLLLTTPLLEAFPLDDPAVPPLLLELAAVTPLDDPVSPSPGVGVPEPPVLVLPEPPP
jgi:hypothetical protein